MIQILISPKIITRADDTSSVIVDKRKTSSKSERVSSFFFTKTFPSDVQANVTVDLNTKPFATGCESVSFKQEALSMPSHPKITSTTLQPVCHTE